MNSLVVVLRRTLWLMVIAAAGGAAWAWYRDRASDDGSLAPAEWPPLEPQSETTPPVAASGSTPTPDTEPAPAASSAASPADSSTSSAASPASSTASSSASSPPASSPSPTSSPAPSATTGSVTASFVNALVDAPEARSTDGVAGGWVEPLDDGSCPISHPIKANDNSGIFHVPDGRFYDRTKAERCYANTDAATADGYRQAKN